MNCIAIIVAGGSGRRMGSEVPKQFLLLNGRPLLMHTLEMFSAIPAISQIRLVLPGDHFGAWQQLCREYQFGIGHEVIAGGSERFHSVKNALANLAPSDIVAIHDGVRPLVSRELIERALHAGMEHDAAIPVMPVVDSLRQQTGTGHTPVERKMFFTVQTPQVFRASLLLKAYEQPYQPAFTDDASVVEQAGFPVSLFKGERFNLKITTMDDLLLAGVLLRLNNGMPEH